MLVVARLRPTSSDEATFLAEVSAAIAAMSARPGHVRTRLARALEDPALWMLVGEWENVGSYRRALSSYDVKLAAGALLGTAVNEPTAFEEIELPAGTAPA
jgi:quinol monooxygenase YgiN